MEDLVRHRHVVVHETFDAIAVELADPGPGVAGSTRHAHMSELAVIAAEYGSPAHQESDSDAGTDGDVREVLEAARRPPAFLGESCAVDVGVEPDARAGTAVQSPDDVRS